MPTKSTASRAVVASRLTSALETRCHSNPAVLASWDPRPEGDAGMGVMELTHLLLEDGVALSGGVLIGGAAAGFASRMIYRWRKEITE